MRAVTPIYYAKRRYNVRGLLGWSEQNEIRLYGYLTVCRPWEMTPRYIEDQKETAQRKAGSLSSHG